VNTPQAFIFDLDGVITDTAEFHYLAWKRLSEEENVPFTREDNEQLRGVSRRESLIRLLKGRTLAEAQMEDWMTRKNAYYRDYLKQISPADLLPGVGNFLQEAKAAGIRIGLGSASRNAHEVLAGLQIADLFDAVGDGFSTVNSKPAPDLFVWVAGRLNIPCREALVFEDAEAGIEAAQRAGMRVVGLGPVERVGRAHLVLSSLAELQLAELLQKLPG
jgi:beta-phosphoglucomutase